jgi:hypothetical protein
MSTLRRLVDAGHVVLYQPSVIVRYRPPVTRSELLARVQEEAQLQWFADGQREATSGRRASTGARRSTVARAVGFARAVRRHELLDAQVALAEHRGMRRARLANDAARNDAANEAASPPITASAAEAVGG